MPRSGTSLVEQIISSHDSVYGAGELSTLMELCISNIKKSGYQMERIKIISSEKNLKSNS